MTKLTPGSIPNSELAPTIAGDQLLLPYAGSFNAAAKELQQAFGFAPRILSPFGGYRTAAEQRNISPATPASVSDHTKGRGVDISNQRQFRNVNEKLFLEILAKHGWKNVDSAGRPFPSEPWHFANQNNAVVTDQKRSTDPIGSLIQSLFGEDIIQRPLTIGLGILLILIGVAFIIASSRVARSVVATAIPGGKAVTAASALIGGK